MVNSINTCCMKKLAVCLIVLLGVWACTPRPKRPGFVPDKKEMAQLLADVYETEALISQGGRSIRRDGDQFVGYYKDVLDKHGVTKLEFDSAISWYSCYPELFSDVYDDVISILSQKDAVLKKELAEFDQAKKDMIEQVSNMKQYWEGDNKFKLPLEENDTSDISFPFAYEIDSVDSGILRLNATYKFNKGNELDSAQMKMILCYADSTADTLRYDIKKSFKKHFGNLSHPLVQGKPLVNVEGMLFEHDTSKVTYVEIEDVKLTLLPNIEVKNIEAQ